MDLSTVIDMCIYLHLVKISVIDMRKQLIFNRDVVILAVLALAKAAVYGSDYEDTMYAVLASTVVFGGLFYAGGGLIGGGDVKLAVAMSIWLGLTNIIIAVYGAFILGGIVGLLCILLKFKSRKDRLAFAPFLLMGAIIAQTLGHDIVCSLQLMC